MLCLINDPRPKKGKNKNKKGDTLLQNYQEQEQYTARCSQPGEAEARSPATRPARKAKHAASAARTVPLPRHRRPAWTPSPSPASAPGPPGTSPGGRRSPSAAAPAPSSPATIYTRRKRGGQQSKMRTGREQLAAPSPLEPLLARPSSMAAAPFAVEQLSAGPFHLYPRVVQHAFRGQAIAGIPRQQPG